MKKFSIKGYAFQIPYKLRDLAEVIKEDFLGDLQEAEAEEKKQYNLQEWQKEAKKK